MMGSFPSVTIFKVGKCIMPRIFNSVQILKVVLCVFLKRFFKKCK